MLYRRLLSCVAGIMIASAIGAARHESGIPNESTNATASSLTSRQSLSTSLVIARDFGPEKTPFSRYQARFVSSCQSAKRR